MLESCWQDIRYAYRSLRRSPIFVATAVLTLALGTGGTTAMFTVIRAVLLKPLPYGNPEQIVKFSGGASPTRYEELKTSAKSFSGIGAYVGVGLENLTLTGLAEPQVIRAARVSANFLTILRVKPIIGRSFEAADDAPGRAPVILISESLWRNRFGQDSDVLGQGVTLSDAPHTIVGVLPARFQFPLSESDVWLPGPAEWPQMSASSRRLSPFLTLFGRLHPNVTLEQANAEVAVLRRHYAQEHPAMLDAHSKSPVEVKLLQDDMVTDVRGMLWMLFGAVSFVLLITCANVASLLLSRASARSREFAVRAAIGASRWRLTSHLLTESLLLSLSGGAMGILLAMLSLRFLSNLKSFDLPRLSEIHLDAGVLFFALALSISTGILFGLTPFWRVSPTNLINMLRGSGLAIGAGHRSHSRSLLVITQIASAVVLLIGAALMMESVVRLRNVNVGFNATHLITFEINLPGLRYGTEQKQSSFFDELLNRLKTMPGVINATAAMTLPMGDFAGTPVQDAAKPLRKLNERPIATMCVVTPGYFRTLQIPIARGRDFVAQDKRDSERVAIIDEALARHFWPQYPAGLSPIGQQMFVGGINPHAARIVGIVAPVHQSLETTAWPETVYVALAQLPLANAMLAVRTQDQPELSASMIRTTIQSMDHNLPVLNFHSMEDRMDTAVGQRRLLIGLLSSFAAISLLLALIGIYGTISYSVQQRVQELAIRSALGAQKVDILQLILGQAVLLAASGIAIGTVASFWLTRSLASLLFQTSATDPATFAVVACLFAACALIASYIPAGRAARIDPIAALRV